MCIVYPCMILRNVKPKDKNLIFLNFLSTISELVWDERGCKTRIDCYGNVTCVCSHTTNFAIIMRPDVCMKSSITNYTQPNFQRKIIPLAETAYWTSSRARCCVGSLAEYRFTASTLAL